MRLTRQAFDEARGVGHAAVGPWDILLALANPDEQSVAGEALRGSGLSYFALREALLKRAGQRDDEIAPDERRWLGINPAFAAVVGRAEGLAAGLGAAEVMPEHLLLALLWDSERNVPFLLEHAGTDRETVLDQLRALGVALPPGQPPPIDPPIDWGERVPVPIEKFEAVKAHLHRTLPRMTILEGKKKRNGAWLVSTSDIDLKAHVQNALNEDYRD